MNLCVLCGDDAASETAVYCSRCAAQMAEDDAPLAVDGDPMPPAVECGLCRIRPTVAFSPFCAECEAKRESVDADPVPRLRVDAPHLGGPGADYAHGEYARRERIEAYARDLFAGRWGRGLIFAGNEKKVFGDALAAAEMVEAELARRRRGVANG